MSVSKIRFPRFTTEHWKFRLRNCLILHHDALAHWLTGSDSRDLLMCCMTLHENRKKCPQKKQEIKNLLMFIDFHTISIIFFIGSFPLPRRCPPLFGPVMKLAEFSCNESDCLLCANLLQKANSERDRTLNCIKLRFHCISTKWFQCCFNYFQLRLRFRINLVNIMKRVRWLFALWVGARPSSHSSTRPSSKFTSTWPWALNHVVLCLECSAKACGPKPHPATKRALWTCRGTEKKYWCFSSIWIY